MTINKRKPNSQLTCYYISRKGRPVCVSLSSLGTADIREIGRRNRIAKTTFEDGSTLSTMLLFATVSSDVRAIYETMYFASKQSNVITDGVISNFAPVRYFSKQKAQRSHRSLRKKLAKLHGSYGLNG